MDLSKAIRKLLRHIPNEHLIGLSSITFMDDFDHKNDQNLVDAAGLYYRSYNMDPAYIELSISGIYGNPSSKRCLMPLIGRFYLAKILFHEIGHHYRHFTHGISQKENEKFANKYSKEFTKKALRHWRILKPFKPLIAWVRSYINKREYLEESESSK